MSDPVTPLSPEAIHAVLLDAYGRIASLRGNVDTVSGDSAFAIGECLGQLSKAKALVGRDIDNASVSLALSAASQSLFDKKMDALDAANPEPLTHLSKRLREPPP
jgi:hypothetical protein